jgi:hypothetical protein
VTSAHLKGLRALGEEFPEMRKLVVCNEPRRREVEGISIMPIHEFLLALWSGDIVGS